MNEPLKVGDMFTYVPKDRGDSLPIRGQMFRVTFLTEAVIGFEYAVLQRSNGEWEFAQSPEVLFTASINTFKI